ncbi:amidase [Labrys wisconsinensis]|uniref:Amidase n=2 Tax=Labrys wisconsinensis TaxID=425677 RepID=A0ABU0JE28_9HYPH|nr:amidase [Labrys wisconsinensis]
MPVRQAEGRIQPEHRAVILCHFERHRSSGIDMSGYDELIGLSAVGVVELLRNGQVSSHDLLDALEMRISHVDADVNALPILCFDRARAHADMLQRRPDGERGRLAGMPVTIKDLTHVAGVRTTQGSPIFADFVPSASDVLVDRLEAEGGIVYAKSNTPEFGAGANTFNEVFGATLNPYDTSRSAAGSSGGAAVALAAGMAWLAHGSDMGGSLRNPASFCGVVGMRPTPGRVAQSRYACVDATLAVQGPMARTVEDVAFLLDAMAGDDARDPLSKPRPVQSFLSAARSGWRPVRVAYSADLGITPVDPEVAEITRRAAERFAEAGVVVEEAHPDLSEAHACFQVLRAQSFATSHGQHLERHRDKLKPEVIGEIERGFALTMAEVIGAERQRAMMTARAAGFFESYDLLLCPATIVPPFPVGERSVKACNGVTFQTYVDWLAIAYAVTLIGAPALSLPCGFTREGLPVGLQIVAAPNGEARVLAGARLLETILDLHTASPIEPRGAKASGAKTDRAD